MLAIWVVIAAATVMGADIGLVILVGLLIGLPTWYFGGYLVARAISKRFPDTPVPALLGEPREVPVEERPAFGAILLVLLMPLVLIFFNTGLSTMEASGSVSDQNVLYQLSRLVGATPVAMALSALTAMLVLYVIPRRRSGQQVGGLLEELVDDALAPVCSIILITGAGGAFGRVLTETGIGGQVAEGLDAMGLPLIIAAYLVTMAMRIAQGSATVALVTAAGLTLTACGGSTGPATDSGSGGSGGAAAGGDCASEEVFCVGLVTDTGKVDGRSHPESSR